MCMYVTHVPFGRIHSSDGDIVIDIFKGTKREKKSSQERTIPNINKKNSWFAWIFQKERVYS